MTFDERYHVANVLQGAAWASLLLLFVIGAPAFLVWLVLNTASLAVRPGLPETFERMANERDLRRRLEADIRAAAADAKCARERR